MNRRAVKRWLATYDAPGSARGRPCKPGQSAARTGCIPSSKQAHAERGEIREKARKWAHQLAGAGGGKIAPQAQAALERKIAGTGLFSPEEAAKLMQSAGSAPEKVVARVKARQKFAHTLGSVLHAANALPSAAEKVAKSAGWPPSVAEKAAKVAAVADWVTHGGASAAVLLAAVASNPRVLMDGAKKAIEARGGVKTLLDAARAKRAKAEAVGKARQMEAGNAQ